jgi:hypothetical protein
MWDKATTLNFTNVATVQYGVPVTIFGRKNSEITDNKEREQIF